MNIRLNREFIELPYFTSRWKALGLTDNDLRRLEEELLYDPEAGPVIVGTGGVRKMRFAFDNRGKSGSLRVIYIDFKVFERIYLLNAYSKNEKDNLSIKERAELKALVKQLEETIKKRRNGS